MEESANEVLPSSSSGGGNSTDDEFHGKDFCSKGFCLDFRLSEIVFAGKIQNKSSPQYQNTIEIVQPLMERLLLDVHDWKKDYSCTEIQFSENKENHCVIASIELTSEQYKDKNRLEDKILRCLPSHKSFSSVNVAVTSDTAMGLSKVTSDTAMASSKDLNAKALADNVTPDISEESLKSLYHALVQSYNDQLKAIQDKPAREYIAEIQTLHKTHKEMFDILEKLHKDGIHLSKVTEGSLNISFSFDKKTSVDRLWELYTSRELLVMLQTIFITKDLLAEYGLESLTLSVHIKEKDYQKCLQNIENEEILTGKVTQDSVNADENDTDKSPADMQPINDAVHNLSEEEADDEVVFSMDEGTEGQFCGRQLRLQKKSSASLQDNVNAEENDNGNRPADMQPLNDAMHNLSEVGVDDTVECSVVEDTEIQFIGREQKNEEILSCIQGNTNAEDGNRSAEVQPPDYAVHDQSPYSDRGADDVVRPSDKSTENKMNATEPRVQGKLSAENEGNLTEKCIQENTNAKDDNSHNRPAEVQHLNDAVHRISSYSDAGEDDAVKPSVVESTWIQLKDKREVNELVKALKRCKEPRFDLRLIVRVHLRSGKTTTIKRLLKVAFDMGSTESTNGIVVIKKGGIRVKDGAWLDNRNATDFENILKRMKTAKKDLKNLAEDVVLSLNATEKDESPTNTRAEADAAQLRWIAIDEDIICYLMIWDFALQSVFNGCHQLFMSHRAMYLLVFDISKELDAEVEDNDVCRLGTPMRMSMKEFLLSSIHMYHGQEMDAFPKVFLIGTHGDLVEQKVAEARMKELKQKISRMPILQRHIVGDFILNNSDPKDTALEKLKQAIFEKVQKEPFWGENRPASWMPLEKEILSKRDDEQKRVLTLQEIIDLNRDCYIALESDEEIQAFLAFQNSLGNMMFVGGNGPDDIVILDPQWLIDSLKQIITHEQFYIRPEGLDSPWEEFIESAKLHMKLLKAVWENNEDKSFIKHKQKLLELLDSADIVCMPKVYNTEGKSEELDYFLVPSMLKPNKDGKQILQAYKQTCKGKSSTLCFVFKDKFMPPAIFARVQAACIKEFRMKDESDKNFIFHGASVFKINRFYDMLLEKCQHSVQVTITSVHEENINPQLCRSILTFFEETLRKITHLYHSILQESDLPFDKAICCNLAEEAIENWIPWKTLRDSKTYYCQHHTVEKWHVMETSSILEIWSGENSSFTTGKVLPENQQTGKGQLKQRRTYLNMQDLGRLGRSISHTDLSMVASTILEQAEIDNLKLDNRDYAALEDKDYTIFLKDIPDDFLDSELSDRSVDQICHWTGKHYKQLAIELCLSPEAIDRVIIEKSSVIDRTRALLREWMLTLGDAATYRAIGKAIVEVGMDLSIIYDCYIPG